MFNANANKEGETPPPLTLPSANEIFNDCNRS